MRSLSLGLLVGALAVVACDGTDRRDAQRIATTVGRMRASEVPLTPSAVGELKNFPCGSPVVCSMRDACAASIEATSKALALKHEVEVAVAALELGTLDRTSPEAKALPTKLDEASRLLDEGHDKLPACDDALAAARRRYRF